MNAQTAEISVVIPYLNQPEHLGNCLKSLMGQDFDLDRVEIFVVDNGSQALPTEICEAYGNVSLVAEKTPGPGPARNKGIAASSAPLLAFIDADCVAGDGWLAAVADAFADPETEVIGGDVRIGLADPDRMTMLEAYESIYAYRQKEYIEQQGFSGTGNLAMRRPVHASVGPFAGIGVAEDRDWGQRARQKGYVTRYVAQMVVYHPARTSMTDLYKKWDRHIAHDYAEQAANSLGGKMRWLVKALALPVSPIWEIGRILASDRVNGLQPRLLAWIALVKIRVYRGRRSFGMLFGGRSAARSQDWNRT